MKHHPEQLDDEIYMWNCGSEGPDTDWRTARMGEIAHDSYGNVINFTNNLRPWFIKRTEVEEAISKLPTGSYLVEILENMLNKGHI